MATIPTASDVLVQGEAETKNIVLHFNTPGVPMSVALPPNVVDVLIGRLALAISNAPVPEVRMLAQRFAIRSIEAALHGLTPTLRYQTEAGVLAQTSIDLADARRLHQELGAMLEHLDSLGGSGAEN